MLINNIFDTFPAFPNGINPLSKVHKELVEDWMMEVSTYLKLCTQQESCVDAWYLCRLIRKCDLLLANFHVLHPTIDKDVPIRQVRDVKEAAEHAMMHPYTRRRDGMQIFFFHDDPSIIGEYVDLGN